MKLKQLFSLALGLFYLLPPLGAEPLNVLVGDLTFTRPTAWKWEAPDPNSPAITRFVVPGRDGQTSGDMRFYGAGPEPETAARVWKGYLAKGDEGSLRTEVATIGARMVTYIFLHGTITMPKDKPVAAQGFVGVVIPYGEKFIHIRFSGPESIVQKAIPDLKNMVNNAVRERESDLENK